MSENHTSHQDTWAQRHRQLRLFISSTFIDMNAERDALTRIFPQIKELCSQRNVEFIPLDLRWGITEEAAKEGRVIETCLREVEDSRPFFIGIIGNRYGWAPQEKDLGVYADSLKQQYPWIKDAIQNRMSITEMEIQHAVLMRKDNQQMNAAFYIRSDKMLVNDTFKETPDSEGDRKLRALKNAIRQQDQFPTNDYQSLDELAEMVLRDVTAFLDRTYPEKSVESFEEEAEKQERLLRNISKSLIPLDRYQQQIDQWITAKTKRDLLITGKVGIGKSYLLAQIVTQLRTKNEKVVYVDCSEQEDIVKAMEYTTSEILFRLGAKTRKQAEDESTLGCLLSFIWGFIKLMFNIIIMPFRAAFGTQHSTQQAFDNAVQDYSKSTQLSIIKTHCKSIGKALKKNPNAIVYLAFDNLDHLSGDELSIYTIFEGTNQVRILSTASSNTKTEIYLHNQQTTEVLRVTNLNTNQATHYVNSYLAQYGKSLDSGGNQCKKILQSGVAGNPMLLGYVLELMVRFGSYEQLSDYINKLSEIKDESQLYELMLKHILAQFTNREQRIVVQETIAAFALVNEGLSESEVQEIFSLKAMDWALLRPYLFSICRHKGMRWKLATEVCRNVVANNIQIDLTNIIDKLATHYENLLQFIQTHKDALGTIDGNKIYQDKQLLIRQVQVLPELYYNSGRWEQLYVWVTYLQADRLFTEEQRVRYWRKLYQAGYNMRDSGDLDLPPYMMYMLNKTSTAYGKGNAITKQGSTTAIKRLHQQYNWWISTNLDKQALYIRWNTIASLFNDPNDMVWLSQKLVNTSDVRAKDSAEVMAEYQKMLAREEWDNVISKAQHETVDELTRIFIDMFVTIAYREKSDYTSAFKIAKNNVSNLKRLGLAARVEGLPIITFYADLSCICGTNEDLDTALQMLDLHKDKPHTRNMDTNNSYIFYQSMAYVHLKKGNKAEALNNALAMKKILTTMGSSTKNADDLIARATK